MGIKQLWWLSESAGLARVVLHCRAGISAPHSDLLIRTAQDAEHQPAISELCIPFRKLIPAAVRQKVDRQKHWALVQRIGKAARCSEPPFSWTEKTQLSPLCVSALNCTELNMNLISEFNSDLNVALRVCKVDSSEKGNGALPLLNLSPKSTFHSFWSILSFTCKTSSNKVKFQHQQRYKNPLHKYLLQIWKVPNWTY